VRPGELLTWWYPVVAWGAACAAVAAVVMQVVAQVVATMVGGRNGGREDHRHGGLLPWPIRAVPVLAGLLAFVPVGGLPVGRWLLGITGPFSVTLVAVLVDQAVGFVRGRPLFDARARWAAIWCALACGLAVYPAALGLGRVDPYLWGWAGWGMAGWDIGGWGVTAVAAVLGAGLLAAGNGFGWTLLAAGVLWQLGALDSANGWDYLVDPVVALLAAAAVAGAGLQIVVSRLFRGGCGGRPGHAK
jgi:hypothetical protein